MDFLSFLNNIPALLGQHLSTLIGLIFLDPPYGSGDLEALMVWLAASSLLQVGGRVVLEQGKRDPIFPWPRRLIVRKQSRYGDTRLTVFESDPAACRDRP